MTKKENLNETNEEVQQNTPDEVVTKLLAEVEELKRKDEENQKKLKMLVDVADKGRVLNYENNQAQKKVSRAKLGVYAGGLIIGWQTIKDELIKHPTTGAIVGENQEYELLILNADNTTKKTRVIGYPAFSDAQYGERIEVNIVAKKEDYEGKITFDVQLDDGRTLSIDPRFLN